MARGAATAWEAGMVAEPWTGSTRVQADDLFAVFTGGQWHKATAARLQAGLDSSCELVVQRGTVIHRISGDRLKEVLDDDAFHVQRGPNPYHMTGQQLKEWLNDWSSPRIVAFAEHSGGIVWGNPTGQLRTGERGSLLAFVLGGGPFPDGSQWRLVISSDEAGSAIFATGDLYAASGSQARPEIDIPADLTVGSTVSLLFESPALRERYVAGAMKVVEGAPPAGDLWTPADDENVLSWFDPSDASAFTVANGTITEWRAKGVSPFSITQETTTHQPVRVTGREDGDWADFNFQKALFAPDNSTVVPPQSVFVSLAGAVQQSTRFPMAESLIQQNYESSTGMVRLFTITDGPSFRWNTDWREQGREPVVPPHWNDDRGAISRPVALSTSPRIVGYTMESGTVFPFRLGDSTSGGASQFLVGDVVVLGPSPSEELIDKVEGFMAHRNGSASELPGNHPFRWSPPGPDGEPLVKMWTPADTELAGWLDAMETSSIVKGADQRVSEWRGVRNGSGMTASMEIADAQPIFDATDYDPLLYGLKMDNYQYMRVSNASAVGMVVICARKLTDPPYLANNSPLLLGDTDIWPFHPVRPDIWFSGEWADPAVINSQDLQLNGTTVPYNAVVSRDHHLFAILWEGKTFSLNQINRDRDGTNRGLYCFCEILYFPASVLSLPRAERLALRDKATGYLAHKWRVANWLPTDHPYKSFPPTK